MLQSLSEKELFITEEEQFLKTLNQFFSVPLIFEKLVSEGQLMLQMQEIRPLHR